MDRRALIASLTAGLVTGLTACSVSERSDGAPKPLPTNSDVTKSPAPEPTQTSEYLIKKMGKDPINTVPKDKRRQIALTIDDGVRPDVVEGYCKIAKETGIRLTFFANGCYMSWKDNKKLLAPLMGSGQVVIGNHTYDHPWLTRISDGEIVSQMQKNEKHFKKLFGHSTEPFMRPPYGAHNSHVRSVLRSEGYRLLVYFLVLCGTLCNMPVTRIKLSQWAKNNSLTYTAAWRMFKNGTLPVKAIQLETGTILIEEGSGIDGDLKRSNRAVVYARVSDSRQRSNCDSQADRLEAYCREKGYEVVRVVKETASGMNDSRRDLQSIISSVSDWDILVIEHRDRLTRFGYGYFESFFDVTGNRIDCVNEAEDDENELMEDLVAFVKSISSRLYGLRRTNRKTEKVIQALEEVSNE